MIHSYNIQHIAVLPANPHIHCSAILVIPALFNIILIPPKNEILNSTTTFGGGIYSRTVKVYSFI